MNSRIEAESTIDLATMEQGWRWHRRGRATLARWAPVLGVLLLVCAAVLAATDPQVRPLAAFFLVLGVWYLVRGAVMLRLFRRTVRKMPLFGATVRWELDDGRLRMNAAGNRSDTGLASLHLARPTPEGLLLYPQKNLYYWLPRSAFASADGFEAAVAEVKQHARWKEIG
jgi:hypothetical protein